MPTDEENIKYLYLVLTHGGVPTIDWDPICNALDLKKGAVTKRWSRLKKSLEHGEVASASSYHFLWLCVKHSTRSTAMDWNAIAEECGTTSGAASKRYSRMKQAFESGASAPTSSRSPSVKKITTEAKATPEKTKGAISSGDEVEATPRSKRKRSIRKKKVFEGDDRKFKPEPDIEDDDSVLMPSKRAKSTKSKVAPKSKNITMREDTPTTEGSTTIKGDGSELDDVFLDAHDYPDEIEDTQADRVNDWISTSA